MAVCRSSQRSTPSFFRSAKRRRRAAPSGPRESQAASSAAASDAAPSDQRTRGGDFMHLQLRLSCSDDHFPDQAEASPMERRRSELAQGAAMVGRRIAAIRLPSIAGIRPRMLGHHPVAGDLGDDRGRGDRAALGVPVDDGFRRALPARAGVSVDEHPGGLLAERFDGPGHRQHPRPVDVDRIDLFDAGNADSPPGRLHDAGVERLPFLDRQVLRIVDSVRKLVAVQNYRAGDHRPGERGAAGLIHSCKRLGEFQLDLEATAARHCLSL
jgi:hypothetical protein